MKDPCLIRDKESTGDYILAGPKLIVRALDYKGTVLKDYWPASACPA